MRGPRHIVLAGAVAALAALAPAGCGKITADTKFEVENAQARSRQAAYDLQTREGVRAGAAQVSDSLFIAPAEQRVRAQQMLPARLQGVNAVSIVSREPLTLADIAARLTRITEVPHIVALGPSGQRVAAEQDGSVARPSVEGDDAGGSVNIAAGGGSTRAASLRIRPNLTGSLGDVLDRVADAFEVEWSVDSGRIIFRDYVTRQYQLSSLPVTSSLSASAAGASSSSSLDIWDEVASTLENLAGDGTRITIGEGTGIVTVTALLPDHAPVRDYIATMNEALGIQIAFDVNVLNVSVSSGEGFGFDLGNLFFAPGNGDVEISGFGSVAPGEGGIGPVNIGIVSGDFAIDAAVDALSTRSDVTVENRVGVTTTNFQAVPVEVVEEENYVASIETLRDENNNVTGTAVSPGTVTTGFVLRLQPRVLNTREILVRYSVELSDLIDIIDFPSGDSTVQLPEVSRANLDQQAILRNGDTLVLFGFERNRAEIGQRGVGNPGFFGLGGSRSASNTRAASVVMITPRILARSRGRP